MKLLARTNLYYIFFSAITYVLVAGAFYFVVEYVVYQEVEKRLIVERHDFENFVSAHGMWEESCYFVENKISLVALNTAEPYVPIFKDTALYDRYSQQLVPFREYSFTANIRNIPYRVSIRKSLIESNELLMFITGTMLVLLSVGLLLLFLFQRRISKTIWKPFYQTLAQAKGFGLNDGQGLKLEQQHIFEFNELNAVLEKMTTKMTLDYRNLKEFTENASHEIQTPLALISSRVEELIQQKNFTPGQMYWIQNIHEATLRLSRMHQALLLLTKIDNGQFYEHEHVNLGAIAEKKLNEWEELFQLKNLSVNIEKTGDFAIEMNPVLADILVSNLIGNAQKHNIAGGSVTIRITPGGLVLINTGPPLSTDPDRLFHRFTKQNQASESLGLGLAIVKRICENYNLTIRYTYQASLHTMTVSRTTG